MFLMAGERPEVESLERKFTRATKRLDAAEDRSAQARAALDSINDATHEFESAPLRARATQAVASLRLATAVVVEGIITLDAAMIEQDLGILSSVEVPADQS